MKLGCRDWLRRRSAGGPGLPPGRPCPARTGECPHDPHRGMYAISSPFPLLASCLVRRLPTAQLRPPPPLQDPDHRPDDPLPAPACPTPSCVVNPMEESDLTRLFSEDDGLGDHDLPGLHIATLSDEEQEVYYSFLGPPLVLSQLLAPHPTYGYLSHPTGLTDEEYLEALQYVAKDEDGPDLEGFVPDLFERDYIPPAPAPAHAHAPVILNPEDPEPQPELNELDAAENHDFWGGDDDDIWGDDEPALGFVDPILLAAGIEDMGLGEFHNPVQPVQPRRRRRFSMFRTEDYFLAPRSRRVKSEHLLDSPSFPSLPEVEWEDKVGTVREKRKWSIARKSGLTGDGALVYGSFGPSKLEC